MKSKPKAKIEQKCAVCSKKLGKQSIEAQGKHYCSFECLLRDT
jgi:hypothetical protein